MFSHTARNQLAERIRRFFGGNPRRVQAAALPWRMTKAGVEVMLITSRDTGRWVVPKGWPEGRESLAESAAREAFEEAGVKGAVAQQEAGRYFYGKTIAGGLAWPCEVAVFPIEVDREARKWREMKQRTRRWMPSQAAAHLVDEPDLGEIITQFCSNPRKIAA